MRRILFAPDSFKGTLTAQEVCSLWQASAARYLPNTETVCLPISDGGEGLLSVLHTVLGGTLPTLSVCDPLGRPVSASYLRLPDGTAVIEMAAAAGLTLLAPGERNPMETTTAGVGQLIAHALEHGASALVLGLGGSATNDGGAGAAAALGLRLMDQEGRCFSPTGGALAKLVRIDSAMLHPLLREIPITIACDVDNPLCGPQGASAVYGPQKGASAAQVQLLDGYLSRLGALLEQDCHRALVQHPGSGAAGGSALPFLAYGNTRLRSGIDIVLDLVDFDRYVADCDLVLTGEGCTDEQSAMGKALSGVSRRAKAKGVPVVVLSGGLNGGAQALYDCGATALFSASPKPQSLETALSHAVDHLRFASDNLFRLLAALAPRSGT